MVEEVKKTPEEEVASKKAVEEAATGGKKDGEGDGDLSPEQQLIAELKGKLEETEKRASQAETERDINRAEKDAARKEVLTAAERQVKTQRDSLSTVLDACKTNFGAAQKEYRDAYDSGDSTKIMDAQIKLNDAQMRLRGAEFESDRFKKWEESGGAKKAVVSSSGSNFSAKEDAWIAKNPRFNTDDLFRGVVYAAHDVAVKKGIEIDSDDYFSHIEGALKRAKLKGDDSDDIQVDPPKKDPPKKNDKQNTAAPPNGSGGNSSGGGGRKNSFEMTPEHRRAAQINFPDEYKKDPKATEEKYARLQLEIADKRAKGELQ